ncbi:MAG: peptidylprolyl isomerase [Sulfuricaulis sp.]|nr:peptidylprolyl isomerase [Sulfuricaulis sp.]
MLMKILSTLFAILLLTAAGLLAACKGPADNPRVRVTTSLGVIELELDARRAPGTVRNFMNYVERGFYNGTIFHRVIPGIIIQGGGFVTGMREKTTGVKLKNEADNGLKNLVGTLAMARTPDPHSAAAQFFINTVDNPSLDHRDKTDAGWGYAVFGKVTKGMDVVKKIEQVSTRSIGPFENVPVKDVLIDKVEILEK